MSKKTFRRVRLADGRMGQSSDPDGGENGLVGVYLRNAKGNFVKDAKFYSADKVEFLEP